jgi:tRNA (cytosine38-C5)-methyltransferase
VRDVAQPYTRNGLRKDADDGRAGSFACLLAALPRMARPPARLLLENVAGFDTSCTREAVMHALGACAYMTH